MLNKIRDYLDFAGLQYRNPDKAGAEREKMLELRYKGQEARKALQNWPKLFQASHPEWQLQQTSQWMNWGPKRLRPHFGPISPQRRTSDRTYVGLTFVWGSTDFGISLEVSFIERRRMSKHWASRPKF